jgi:hypothetical protein
MYAAKVLSHADGRSHVHFLDEPGDEPESQERLAS